MNRLFNINWTLIFDKVGTILVDRRFWTAIFVVVGTIAGVPELTEGADSLSGEAVDWINTVAPIVVMILAYLGVTISWTNRPPSGLRFKEQSSEVDEFIEKLSKELNS